MTEDNTTTTLTPDWDYSEQTVPGFDGEVVVEITVQNGKDL